MNAVNGRIALLDIPESKRARLVKEAKEKLRQKAIEARMWRWLLEVNNLTINGYIVFSNNRQPKKVRHRKKVRAL